MKDDFGSYGTPRTCEREGCTFSTLSRSDYWDHRLAHENADETGPIATGPYRVEILCTAIIWAESREAAREIASKFDGKNRGILDAFAVAEVVAVDVDESIF